jgi:hypothetical protein
MTTSERRILQPFNMQEATPRRGLFPFDSAGDHNADKAGKEIGPAQGAPPDAFRSLVSWKL